MSPHDPFAPVGTLATDIADGRVSAVSVMETTLERIHRIDPLLDSFICLAPDPLAAARAADDAVQAGRPLGQLHGVPLGIKDNYLQ